MRGTARVCASCAQAVDSLPRVATRSVSIIACPSVSVWSRWGDRNLTSALHHVLQPFSLWALQSH
eukprot:7976809-Lingulodinium_polyedra.AAC.1